MSRIHVLGRTGKNSYRVVVHDTTPGGNNAAGVPWTTCLVNGGLAFTTMNEGSGLGQITTAEKLTVENGTVLEGTFDWTDNPALTNPQRQASLDAAANQLLLELQATIAERFRYFGFNR